MLLNLLWNSVKFTPRGGRITVSTEASADRFMFVISDTGRGIAAEEFSALTSPFVQGQSNPYISHDGVGLGLAITQSLAQMHGGEIDIQSTLGEGTTVTIALPFDPIAAQD